MTNDQTRCGFITLAGLPNSGKSTFLNQCVGQKVSIVSRKSQTTRRRILGIALQDQSQLVFVDTPGLFQPKKTMDQYMVRAAQEALLESDVVIWVVDATRRNLEPFLELLEQTHVKASQVFLVLNKIDQVKRDTLLALADRLSKAHSFDKIFMISALKNDGVQDVLSVLATLVPSGPWLYPEDQVTDLPQRLLAAEITREAIFHSIHDELPYHIHVETDTWHEKRDGSVVIQQTIHVDKENHKAIVIGRAGQQLKIIGERARKEAGVCLGRVVHLKLHVKVTQGWTERVGFLKEILGMEGPVSSS
jgi:GTP-binding protein Era